MEKLSTDAEKIMIERFGKDNIIALATTVDNRPYVRSVNSFYDKGSFYVLTYGTVIPGSNGGSEKILHKKPHFQSFETHFLTNNNIASCWKKVNC